MGVQRFRTGEAMNAEPASTGRDEGFERFLRHSARYRALWPRIDPRGVAKFKSIDEAQAARAAIAARGLTQ